MIEELANQWLDLLSYCDDRASFDPKMFAMRSKNISDAYKRLSYEQQGEFHHIVCHPSPTTDSR